MQIDWSIRTLTLEKPFKIAKGVYRQRRALIIKMIQEGQYGLGEATEISYYNISLERLVKLLLKHQSVLSNIRMKTPEAYFKKIWPLFSAEPFLLSALDCAAYDLHGKLNGMPTMDYLGLRKRSNLPSTSFTIGIDHPSKMIDAIREKPWPIYKVKLGTKNDLEIIRAIRAVCSSPLRIDVNEGWSNHEAPGKVSAMINLGITLIEQPLHRSNLLAMKQLTNQSNISLIADESCQGLDDIHKCSPYFSGVNIKLMKCGGLTPARQMISRARDLGLEIMIGCMTESSIGISAAAQLIPLVDYVDLDGSMLITNDIATGVSFDNGKAKYPKLHGLGCMLDGDMGT